MYFNNFGPIPIESKSHPFEYRFSFCVCRPIPALILILSRLPIMVIEDTLFVIADLEIRSS